MTQCGEPFANCASKRGLRCSDLAMEYDSLGHSADAATVRADSVARKAKK